MAPLSSDEKLARFLAQELAWAGYAGTFSPLQGWQVERLESDANHPSTRPPPSLDGTPDRQTQSLLEWLDDLHRNALDVPVLAPRHDVRRVHDLAERLYGSYRVEGGSVRMAGCRLEYRPLVRVAILDEGPPRRFDERFFDATGNPVDAELARRLRLHDLMPLVPHPPFDNPPDLERIVARVQEDLRRDDAASRSRVLWPSVVAVHYAIGKLEFVFDQATASVAFEGWAQGIRDGWIAAPPFRCPVTGRTSHTVVITDHDEVTVPEATDTCEVSGQRRLITDLERSSVSDRLVARDLLVQCPVSGQWLLEEEQVRCQECHQSVSPLVVGRGRCRACRSLRRVPADDHRIVRLTDAWTFWKRDRHWRLAETQTVYIVECQRWLEAWRLVVDKSSLKLLRLAHRRRWQRKWVDVDPNSVDTEEP